MDAVKLAKENESFAIEVRRNLHKIPELELELPKTVAYICSKLDEMNVEYKKLVNGNAIVATIYGTKPGKNIVLGIRADMDALPITEETGLEFASTHKGCMHACGHDGHSAMALTVLKILNENKSEFSGAVKFLFQPGEEIPGGAKPMIDEKALEDPKVDYIIGLHEGGLFSNMKVGNIGFKSGPLMACMDKFTIKINGKGGHGANPQITVDPIIISAEVLLGLQKIISRELPPVSKALISVCQINGGTSQNIIPNSVEMVGTSRALSEADRDIIEKRIFEISDGIARTYGGSAELNYERKYPVLVNDDEFTKFVKDATEELFGDDVIELPEPTMGGEDMAFFLQEVPGTYFMLGNLNKNADGNFYPHHNSKFDVDETQFYKGIATMVNVVDKLMGGNN